MQMLFIYFSVQLIMNNILKLYNVNLATHGCCTRRHVQGYSIPGEWKAPCYANEKYFSIKAISYFTHFPFHIKHSGFSFLQVTPAQSRERNKHCIVLNFFDHHDIWHFLSSCALFFSFMVRTYLKLHLTKIKCFNNPDIMFMTI